MIHELYFKTSEAIWFGLCEQRRQKSKQLFTENLLFCLLNADKNVKKL